MNNVINLQDPKVNEFMQNLNMFTGTSQYFKHPLVHNYCYTDGTRYFFEKCSGGAYWFNDIVATEIAPLMEKHDFLVVFLYVKDKKAIITASDGNDATSPTLFEREIEFTDAFPGTWKFYMQKSGERTVFFLPSEY
tara:strand:- start:1914 stop:2321 length:408 start_codon:yes stop_codon:yes gene_type:complete